MITLIQAASNGQIWAIIGPMLYAAGGALIFFLIKLVYENIIKSSDKNDDILKETIKGNVKLEEEKNSNIHGRIDDTNNRVDKTEGIVEKLVSKMDEYVTTSQKHIVELTTNNKLLTDNKESDKKTFLEVFSTAMKKLNLGLDDPIVRKDLGLFVDERLENVVELTFKKTLAGNRKTG